MSGDTPTEAEELARLIAVTEERHWSRTNEHDPTSIAEQVAELAGREVARLRAEADRLTGPAGVEERLRERVEQVKELHDRVLGLRAEVEAVEKTNAELLAGSSRKSDEIERLAQSVKNYKLQLAHEEQAHDQATARLTAQLNVEAKVRVTAQGEAEQLTRERDAHAAQSELRLVAGLEASRRAVAYRGERDELRECINACGGLCSATLEDIEAIGDGEDSGTPSAPRVIDECECGPGAWRTNDAGECVACGLPLEKETPT